MSIPSREQAERLAALAFGIVERMRHQVATCHDGRLLWLGQLAGLEPEGESLDAYRARLVAHLTAAPAAPSRRT